jgi:hypothetical protein
MRVETEMVHDRLPAMGLLMSTGMCILSERHSRKEALHDVGADLVMDLARAHHRLRLRFPMARPGMLITIG